MPEKMAGQGKRDDMGDKALDTDGCWMMDDDGQDDGWVLGCTLRLADGAGLRLPQAMGTLTRCEVVQGTWRRRPGRPGAVARMVVVVVDGRGD